MSKIKTTTELIYRLKVNGVELSYFDYQYGKTKDSYLETHPLISRGKRFYQNPHFWTFLLDSDLNEEVDFIYNMSEFVPDYNILAALVVSSNRIVNRYFKPMATEFFNNSGLSIEMRKQHMDRLMTDCSYENKLDFYKILKDIAEEGKIEPLYNNYANAGRGYCLYNASKYKDGAFARYLLENGADVTMNDSMAFPTACKEGNYKIALELVKHGADIHTKKNLGKVMMLRNELKERLTDEEKAIKEKLLSLYEDNIVEEDTPVTPTEEKNNEPETVPADQNTENNS